MHRQGLGTPKDPARAQTFLARAREHAEAGGCKQLAGLRGAGEGVTSDEPKAVALYR